MCRGVRRKGYDWMVRRTSKNPIAYQTDGLRCYGSLEVELLLPLAEETAVSLLDEIGRTVRKGLHLEDGLLVEHILGNSVFFFQTKESQGDKDVFRAVLPDEKNFFPWDRKGSIRCNALYRSQICLDRNKAFFCKVADLAAVEEYGTAAGSIFHSFKKRGTEYVRVLQYYMADSGKGDELIRLSPYCTMDNGIWRFLSQLEGLYEVEYQVICADLEETDPIHESFLNYWRKYS